MISNFGTISKLLFTFKAEKNDDMVGTFDQQETLILVKRDTMCDFHNFGLTFK